MSPESVTPPAVSPVQPLSALGRIEGRVTIRNPDLGPSSATTVHVEPTAYSVSPIPYGDMDHDTWAITVERRSADTWAVCRPRRCMNAAGVWSWESLPSSREDDWLAEHRFALDTALDLAKRHAPDVCVNGMTAQEVADVR